MITDEELNRLDDNFETASLLRAVDEIDKMRGLLNDRDHHRPPQIRDDLLKLHGLADRLINARAKGVGRVFFDLANGAGRSGFRFAGSRPRYSQQTDRPLSGKPN